MRSHRQACRCCLCNGTRIAAIWHVDFVMRMWLAGGCASVLPL